MSVVKPDKKTAVVMEKGAMHCSHCKFRKFRKFRKSP